MPDSPNTRLFKTWLRSMDIDIEARNWRAEAAKLLGKSERMMGYYFEGHTIPPNTLMLMDALEQGFKPRKFGT